MAEYKEIVAGQLFEPGDILTRTGKYHAKFTKSHGSKFYDQFGIYLREGGGPIWEILLPRTSSPVGTGLQYEDLFLRVTEKGAEIFERQKPHGLLPGYDDTVLWKYHHDREQSTSDPFLYLGDNGEFVLQRYDSEGFCILMTKGAQEINKFVVEGIVFDDTIDETTVCPKQITMDLDQSEAEGTQIYLDERVDLDTISTKVSDAKITFIDHFPPGSQSRIEDYEIGFDNVYIGLPYLYNIVPRPVGDRRPFLFEDAKEYDMLYQNGEARLKVAEENFEVKTDVTVNAGHKVNFAVRFTKTALFNLTGQLVSTYVSNEGIKGEISLSHYMTAKLSRPYKPKFTVI